MLIFLCEDPVMLRSRPDIQQKGKAKQEAKQQRWEMRVKHWSRQEAIQTASEVIQSFLEKGWISSDEAEIERERSFMIAHLERQRLREYLKLVGILRDAEFTVSHVDDGGNMSL